MKDRNAAVVEIAQTAIKFKSSVILEFDHKCVDVKSILGLITAFRMDRSYILHVIGPDEEEAKAAMAKVFEKHFISVITR